MRSHPAPIGLLSIPFLAARCTLIGSTLLAGLAGCAPPLDRGPPHCGGRFYEKASFEGDFVHRVVDVTTVEGAYVPPRTTTDARPARLAFGEDYLVGSLDESAFVVRVLEHFDGSLSRDAPCGVVGPADPYAPPWEERALARIDWWVDLGDILREIDPGLTVIEAESPALFDETHFDLYGLTIEADGFSVTTLCFPTPPGCSDDACRSIVRLTQEFRRALP